MVGGEHSLKISAPQLLWFWIDSVLKILNERITQSINQPMYHEGVYRTAPDTPGLLMIHTMFNEAVCEAAIKASSGLINQVNIDSRLLKDFCRHNCLIA